MKNKINNFLISKNIYALYGDGSFSTTENLKDDWIMLIDIGRHRHTISTNKSTTISTEYCGLNWENNNVVGDGTYLVIDDDLMVHQSVKTFQEDFDSVKSGDYYGIMEMTERFYMDKNGDFKYIK